LLISFLCFPPATPKDEVFFFSTLFSFSPPALEFVSVLLSVHGSLSFIYVDNSGGLHTSGAGVLTSGLPLLSTTGNGSPAERRVQFSLPLRLHPLTLSPPEEKR